MKNIMVVSHHRRGGGAPLDSLWFSRDVCAAMGLRLWFVCGGSRGLGLRALLRSRCIVFDGIYCLALGYAPWIYSIGSMLGKRMAVYWHETEWHAERAMRYASVRRMMKNPAMVHFHVCDAGKRMLVEKYGVEESRVRVLHNITDDSRISEPRLSVQPMSAWVAACGDVYERKGPDLFIEIARRVAAVQPEARFFWLGEFRPDGFSESSIRDSIRSAGLDHHIIFAGGVRNPSYLLSHMRCVLLTSRDEPMPKILMEALAIGKEVIAFDVGGVRELLGGLGTLIPAGDVDAFAEALIAAMDREWTGEQQEACRRRYREMFTPDAFAKRFELAVAWWEARES